jgi:hypothetical protein
MLDTMGHEGCERGYATGPTRGVVMDHSTTDLERAASQVAGLERFLRARLFNALTRLFLVLVLVGGLITALTPGSHFLETASICLVVAVAFATWFVAHYLRLVRGLRTDPVHAVARLHKKRKVKSAGFVDVTQSSKDLPQARELRDSDAPETDAPKTDPYAALRDVDVFDQKSADGVNRTDDPSRGPIE